jgi:hypothetical protein
MKTLPEAAQRTLWDVAVRVVPPVAELDETARAEFFTIIDNALADRPEAVRRQIALFLRVLNLAPVVRFGATLSRLDGERRDRVLRWFQEAPVTKLRQGFWGLKTMVFMGYYGRVASWKVIGYEPGGGAYGEA